MSQENIERTHRAYEALQQHDIDGFLTYVEAEVEWHSLVLEMEGTLHGHDGVRLWWANLLAVFPDWDPVLVEARDLGDFGIDEDFWQAAEMRSGVIVWYGAFRMEADALGAVGLRE